MPSVRLMGDRPLGRGALFHLLKNRVYLGEITHREKSYPGGHPAIIDATVFDHAQILMGAQTRRNRATGRAVSTMPLRGLVFDAAGRPMTPVFTHGARGQVYRYYVTSGLQRGRRTRDDADNARASAPAIEALVQSVLDTQRVPNGTPMAQVVARVDLQSNEAEIT